MRPLSLALLALLVGLSAAALARGEGDKVEEGKPAPDFSLPATQIDKVLPGAKDKTTLSLKDLRGKNVVLYFFPKASTRG
jgi:peroxiredoxin Q/BCP